MRLTNDSDDHVFHSPYNQMIVIVKTLNVMRFVEKTRYCHGSQLSIGLSRTTEHFIDEITMIGR